MHINCRMSIMSLSLPHAGGSPPDTVSPPIHPTQCNVCGRFPKVNWRRSSAYPDSVFNSTKDRMSKIIVFAKCVKHQLYHPRRRAMKPKRKTCVLLCGLIVLCSLSGCAVLPSISYSHCFVINTFINMRRRLRRRRPQELNELILQLGFDVFESHAEKGRSMNLVRYFCPHLGRAGPVFTILDSDPLLVVKHIYIF